ncbi:MAG: nicotinate-nicotinamide nucleotide adenylyltransferase [Parcubacteria group bacterium]|jgi:nicotinate-nucleotide adenylyltransferase
MKIALGGSASNPAHYGHKFLAEAVLKTGEFDRVRWIVSGERPDKPGMPAVFHRWQMTQLLAMDQFIEIAYEKKQAVSTVEVIRRTQQEFPQAEIVWYCGSDHFLARRQFAGVCDVEAFWEEGEWLMNHQPFLIAVRKGATQEKMRYPEKCLFLESAIPEISSTHIRQNVRDKKDNQIFTAPAVLQYMEKNRLYY